MNRLYLFLPTVAYRARRALLIAASLLVAAGIGTLATLMVRSVDIDTGDARAGVEEIIRARDADRYVDLGINSEYVFNQEQITKLLDTIEREFLMYNDNMVCVDINRLLNSNTHAQIRQRMLFLRSYLRPPTFASFRDSYSYSDVATEIHLYRSCYVKWRGTITNIKRQDALIQFDLLVGYDSGNVLEGIVKSVSDIDAEFLDNSYYEIIAQVSSDSSNELMLYVTAIRALLE